MIKALLLGAVAAALVGTSAAAASLHAEAPAWIVSPAADNCLTELELTGASGVTVPATLVSDGDGVTLVFAKTGAPERAFLPIRIDHKPYSNLVLRRPDGRTAAMQLTPEALSALRKGGSLQITWLADEPVQTRLTGSEQALADLRTCGAQVAQRYRSQRAAERDAQARADAEARAKALADEQLAAAKAQRDAAEAEARRSAAEAEHLRAQADAERRQAQAQADDDAREQADEQAQAEAYPYARAGSYQDPRDGYYRQDPYSYSPPRGYRGGW